jgi:hypothetical protein
MARQTHSLVLGAFGLWFALLLPLRPSSLLLPMSPGKAPIPDRIRLLLQYRATDAAQIQKKNNC